MLIGLTGLKGVGKDTVGAYLVANHKFQRVAFADPLKIAVANLFDLDIERVDGLKTDSEIPLAEVILQVGTTEWSYSWREFLQRFGTEMGRNTFGYDFWVDQWQATAEPLLMSGMDVVVTDCRFENEAQRIGSFNGYIVQIDRPGHWPDGHASEVALDDKYIDTVLLNDGSQYQFNHHIEELMEDIISGS